MSRRRRGRRIEKARRHAPPTSGDPPREIIREAKCVERLAYTRSQAAEALGISRSTFIRRVLPYVETLEMPWGAKLIPVDELERLLAVRRRAARARVQARPPGRPTATPPDVVARIRAERAAGKSLRQIALDLNASGVATAHGGAEWWPSAVRNLLLR
jgi:hypothetical protein